MIDFLIGFTAVAFFGAFVFAIFFIPPFTRLAIRLNRMGAYITVGICAGGMGVGMTHLGHLIRTSSFVADLFS